MKNLWTITRQHYWHDGTRAVEISFGGMDYTGPDALTKKYPNEFSEYADPREAVADAIVIAEKWRSDSGESIKMVFGCNLDMVTGDPVSIAEAKRTFPKAAKTWYDKQPKCDCGCGELLPEHPWELFAPYDYDEKYASENCAERGLEFHEKQAGEWEADLQEAEKE